MLRNVEVELESSEAEEWASGRDDSSDEEINCDELMIEEGEELEEEATATEDETGVPLIRVARPCRPRMKLRDGELCRVGCRDDEWTRLNFVPKMRWRACIKNRNGKLFAAGWSRSAEPMAFHNGVSNCVVDECTHDTPFCGARFLVMQQLNDIRVQQGIPLPVDGL